MRLTSIGLILIIDFILIIFIYLAIEYLEHIDFKEDKKDAGDKTKKIAEGSAIVTGFMAIGIFGVTLICSLNTFAIKKLCDNLNSLKFFLKDY